jgi:hypothetical protein
MHRIFNYRNHSKHLTMKTAMQDLIDDLNGYLNVDISPLGLNMIRIIKERAEGKLIKERNQIEDSYNNAKSYPSSDCDGCKYYFMTYITND